MGTTVREELQGDFFSTLRKGQEVALDGLTTLVKTVQLVTPAMPVYHVPLADRLPTAHEIVAGSNDFAEHLLANQRQFADEVISAASPLLPGVEDAHAAKAGKPAAKAGKPAAKAGKPAAK